MKRLIQVFVLILFALPSLAHAQVSTHSTSVTVDSTQYNLETLYGSYGANIATLQATPWWGNSTLANDLANAVLHSLGDAGGNLPAVLPSGALFATSQVTSTVYVTDYDGTSVRNGTTTYSDDYSFVNFVSSVALSTASDEKSGLRPERQTLAPDLIPSNVPTCSGSTFVSGFQIVGNGQIDWYVEARKADNCFDVPVTVLPEGLRIYDTAGILAYLGLTDVDVYTR